MNHYIVRGIISLHGDAFQRQGARVKTSILCLEKTILPVSQPAFFAWESQYIGVDDVVTRTPESVAQVARANAKSEMEDILQCFNHFLNGEKGEWLIAGEQLNDLMDVKFLKPWSASFLRDKWDAIGASATKLSELVDPIESSTRIDPKAYYSFLRVTYAGRAERGESRRGDELSYKNIGIAKGGDIVVSNIGAVYGSTCVMPEGLEDCLISSEFTVMRLKEDVKADPMYLWSVLRSPAVLAEWISDASGVSRHRVQWGALKSLAIPLLSYAKQKEIGDLYREMLKKEQQAIEDRKMAEALLSCLNLDAEKARERLIKAKPPK